jgi:hypothetical protein
MLGNFGRDLFFNGEIRRLGPCLCGPVGRAGPPWTDGGALTGARPPAAPVHQSSPAGAQKGERSCKGSAASEARSGGVGEQRRGGFPTGVGWHGGEDGTDTRDPCVSLG